MNNNSNKLTTTTKNPNLYTKVLQNVAGLISIKTEILTGILQARTNNIRAVLQSKDNKQIEGLQVTVQQMIYSVAVLYTSVNFDKQAKRDIDILINESANFVIKNFPMLSVGEIKTAFEFAACHKIDANLSAWNGKLTIQMIGDVLSAYYQFRQNAIARYDNKVELIMLRQKSADCDRRNEQAKQAVIDLFNELKKTYQQTGEIDPDKIKPYQGKILVDSGLITFTTAEKIAIHKEAKKQAVRELKNDIQDINQKPVTRRTLKAMLGEIENGAEQDDFKSRVNSIYSVLLIKKSILL